MKFELLQAETVYTGRAFAVRCDHLRTPDGRTVKYDIIEHTGSIILVPVNDQGQIYFVRQYRHAAQLDLLELPAGTLEPGEAPIAGAAREIREEIGLEATNLLEIGTFYLAPGYSTERMHVFLATGLRHNPLEADADEFLSVEALPITEALRQAENGEMQDAKSLAALLLAKRYL
ncbi:MAG: ADP-ribose pyrophosphatase [Anaerolineae bacterium]|nr:MAG: ADP-ribose pyrophosphatase [Anaerolineae bacterium]